MTQQRLNSEAQILDLLANRWSSRAFDNTQAVEAEKLRACLEAARWSPSCFGDEPWRFVVANRSSHAEGWQKMLATLADKNQLWAKHAPVLILACSARHFAHNGADNRWSQYDTGQAMMSLALQATADGLMTHTMGGFDPIAIAKAFHIPDDFTPMSVIAIGYPAEINTLDESFHSMEKAGRQRKALRDIAFTSWGEGWQA